MFQLLLFPGLNDHWDLHYNNDISICFDSTTLKKYLAKAVRETSLKNFLDLSGSGSGSGSRDKGGGLEVSPVLNASRRDGVQNGLCLKKNAYLASCWNKKNIRNEAYTVLSLSLNPNRGDRGRLDTGHSVSHGNVIGLGFGLGGSLNGSELVGDGGGLRLLNGLGL